MDDVCTESRGGNKIRARSSERTARFINTSTRCRHAYIARRSSAITLLSRIPFSIHVSRDLHLNHLRNHPLSSQGHTPHPAGSATSQLSSFLAVHDFPPHTRHR